MNDLLKRKHDATDRLIERSLTRPQRSSTACPDAETLAAWVDRRGLTTAAATEVEAHLSSCGDCQAVIATVVRATPAALRSEPWWRRATTIRWLVPLTAAAAAVAVWVAIPNDARNREAGNRVAPSVQPASPRADLRPGDELRQKESKDNSLTKNEQAAATAATQGAAALTAPSSGAPAAQDATPTFANATAPQEAAASSDLKKQGAREEAATAARRRALAAPEAVAGEIRSSDSLIRWRVGRAGAVDYSTNGGLTWEALSTGVSADLAAGSSPSPTVCWVVGRTGTVILSLDGRTWQRLPFPEPTDLTSVRALDGRTATVAGAGRGSFRTSDGGQTWTRLQEF